VYNQAKQVGKCELREDGIPFVATHTAAQRQVLSEIKETAEALAIQEAAALATRVKLRALMVEAKKIEVSSYSIAEEAHISQPRVLQIIKRWDPHRLPTPSTPQKTGEK
jgi:hypothetical protein